MYLSTEFLKIIKERLKEKYEYGGDIWEDYFTCETASKKNRSPPISLDSLVSYHTHPTDYRGVYFPPSTPDIMVILRLILKTRKSLRHFIFSDKKIYFLYFTHIPFNPEDIHDVNVYFCQLYSKIQDLEYTYSNWLKSDLNHKEVFREIYKLTGCYIMEITWPKDGQALVLENVTDIDDIPYFSEVDVTIDMSQRC